jgi:hypothetical protein
MANPNRHSNRSGLSPWLSGKISLPSATAARENKGDSNVSVVECGSGRDAEKRDPRGTGRVVELC